jgi:hypothetical protein
MAAIKVENADPHSSIPLVFDVTSPDATEPLATHNLAFGDFVIIGSLDNLHMVTVEEWQTRKKVEAEEAEAKAQAAAREADAPTGKDFSDVQPAMTKLKRKELEEMTKEDLVAYADDRDIDVNGHWNKADIIDAIVRG